MPKQFVVDVQGFQAPGGTFVFKEVAIAPLQPDAMTKVFCFLPPSPAECLPLLYQTTNRWLEFNHHGILWQAGTIPYTELRTTLLCHLPDCKEAYVKGREKAKWLKQQLPSIHFIDLEDQGCPSLSTLPEVGLVHCANHHVCKDSQPVCALQNVKRMLAWLEEQRQEKELRAMMRRCHCDCPHHTPISILSIDEDYDTTG